LWKKIQQKIDKPQPLQARQSLNETFTVVLSPPFLPLEIAVFLSRMLTKFVAGALSTAWDFSKGRMHF
jgi:hypothetical protein